jgi:hypothetical protein
MSIKLGGHAAATEVEIEAGHLAARFTQRPIDVGSGGSFQLGNASGVIGAGLASSSPIFTARYGGSATAIVRRIRISAITLGTGFAAGLCVFSLFAARAYTASASGGTSLAPSTGGKMKTGMGSSQMADIRIASTGTLTAGTRTLDAQPLATLCGPGSATASTIIIPPQSTVFDDANGSDWPLVLANNEGFELQATVPATGTWSFAVNMIWEEVSTYGVGVAS